MTPFAHRPLMSVTPTLRERLLLFKLRLISSSLETRSPTISALTSTNVRLTVSSLLNSTMSTNGVPVLKVRMVTMPSMMTSPGSATNSLMSADGRPSIKLDRTLLALAQPVLPARTAISAPGRNSSITLWLHTAPFPWSLDPGGSRTLSASTTTTLLSASSSLLITGLRLPS